MPLPAGVRLGPYEITAQIGAGGMGEVYKARDTRLDRIVAVKVLPAALAADPQFRERFDREARAISKLTHPHICTLYDVGRSEDVDFIVMELLEGETLAERLDRGAMPLAQALTVAIAVASALDAAHRHGIVHRDLKPGNVMLTKGGAGSTGSPQAKLLDFGLAKAGAPAIAGGGLSGLPTTPPTLTAQGTILGTFQYMAPEQLEGREADARTDIFAFGALLYETLTGKKAFEGTSHASLIGAIMHADPPPVTQLQPVAPAALTRLVATCLAKDPDDRWQSARDLMRELRWVAEGRAAPEADAGTTPQRGSGSVWSRALPWTVAGVLAVALVAVAASALRPTEKPPATPVTRLSITPPDKTRFDNPSPPALSPDGTQVVFAAIGSDGKKQLWLRPLDSLTARPLAETDDGIYPFWSPDSTSIGFFASGKLQRMNVSGGPVTTLADAPTGRGGTWSPSGIIVFAPSIYSGLYQIAASGGSVRPAVRLDPKAPPRRFPCFLPDGRHFLYLFGAGGRDQQTIRIGSVDSTDDDRILLSSADSSAMYTQGRVVFVRGTALVARPFDATRLELTGEEVPVAERLRQAQGTQIWMFAVSSTGVLAYESGGATARRLTWVDRAGQQIETLGEPGEMNAVEFSPDRRSVAVSIREATGGDDYAIWLYDVARGLRTRFTSGPGIHSSPAWSPDRRAIVFASNRKGRFDLYRQSADGSGTAELLFADNLAKEPGSFSPDGAYLAYGSGSDAKTASDIWILPQPLGPPGASKPSPFMRTEFNEGDPRFSPDGRWIAYESNESGRSEVYVTPFPGPGGKKQVSTAGGHSLRWRADGNELFYVASNNRLMAAHVDAKGAVLDVRNVEALFPITGGYDVDGDGRRFLVTVPVAGEAVPQLTVMQNWIAPTRSGK